MKTLFISLLFLISCGKNTNHSNRELIEMRKQENLKKVNDRLPNELVFKAGDHQIHFKTQRSLSHHFYEVTTDLARYYSFELSHIQPDSLYRLQTDLSSRIELYLHDQGRDILLNQENFKINLDILERLSLKKAYLFLSHSQKKDDNGIIIKNYQTGESQVWKRSLQEYFKDKYIEATPLNIDSLIQHKGDNDLRWWVKKDSPKQYKIVYSTLNDLKESFFNNFSYQKFTLKRVNGKASSLNLNGYSYFRISGTRTLQKKKERKIKKVYYTNIDNLPYHCSFVEAESKVISKINLSNSSMREALNRPNLYLNSWNYYTAPSLQLELKRLSSGYFDIGIISRNCVNAKGPKIQKKKVNVEKELELVIESYSRRE